MILIIFLHALSTFSLTKNLLNFTQPIFLIGIRMFVAGLALIMLQYIFGSRKFKLEWHLISYYLQVILFALYIPYILRYYGLLYCCPDRAYLIYNLGPIITYIVTFFLGIEKLNLIKILALVISFCGIMLNGNITVTQLAIPSTHILADISLLLSVIVFSYGWFIIRKLTVDLHQSPIAINSITMLASGFLALCTSIFTEQSPYITEYLTFIYLLIVIILVSNIICHNLYALLLQNYSLTLIALGNYLSPFIGQLYKIIFLGASAPTLFYSYFLLVFAGFVLFYIAECKAYLFDLNSNSTQEKLAKIRNMLPKI